MKIAGRLISVALIALVALAFVAVSAKAAPTPRVIASAKAAGEFALTSTSARKSNAKAIYLRAYGRGLSAHAVVACSRGFSIGSKSKSFRTMLPARLYRLPLPFAGSCDVTASLSGEGRIRLQILTS